MKSNNKGSFTVEAALVLPIFFFAILAFIFLFRTVLMQMQLQGALSDSAAELSGSAYLTNSMIEKSDSSDELSDSFSYVGGKIATGAVTRKYFVSEPYYDNMLGHKISYISSSYLVEGEEIDLISQYTIKFPVPIIQLCKFPVIQRVKTRAFIGTDKLLSSHNTQTDSNSENETYVYVTETGSVYHVSLECSSLKLNISECLWGELANRRNVYGGRYKPCEKCCNNKESKKLVYICSDGDAYQTSLNCSGLKRTIHRIKEGEAKLTLRMCSKCGG